MRAESTNLSAFPLTVLFKFLSWAPITDPRKPLKILLDNRIPIVYGLSSNRGHGRLVPCAKQERSRLTPKRVAAARTRFRTTPGRGRSAVPAVRLPGRWSTPAKPTSLRERSAGAAQAGRIAPGLPSTRWRRSSPPRPRRGNGWNP